MTAKTEAERLADEIQQHHSVNWIAATGRNPTNWGHASSELCWSVGVELRRLQSEVERLTVERDELRTLHECAVIEGGKMLGENLSDEPRAKWLLLAISKIVRERDELRSEVERTGHNRDMWKSQCERQAMELENTRAEAVLAVNAAVAAEREQCARMAENYDLGTPEGHAIAAAIRKGK